jgi:phosphoribosylamine--glycine ligase
LSNKFARTFIYAQARLTISARSDYRCGGMKILVIGSGGREHALVWKLRQSPSVESVWCAPGNGGISADVKCFPINQTDSAAMANLAAKLGADLTVIGPELPLVSGVADEFARRGMALFGPSKAAAELEGSKIYAKEFLQRHNIPTAGAYGFYDSPNAAYAGLKNVQWPMVIKADGLCAGKGVLVAQNYEEAKQFLERMMEKREFGDGGSRVLLEHAIRGEELSLIVMTDGERIAAMAPARDHKRAFDNDEGPNTGGMGAYSCDELLPADLAARIEQQIVQPAIRGMASEGRPYRGFLYFGLMLTAEGPSVLEFNCRMGDPEAQAIIYRMDFDLAEALASCAAGKLDVSAIRWKREPSVCVVMAAEGYPANPKVGREISGLQAAETVAGVKVFVAGVRAEGIKYYTSSGRVLGVTAKGPSLCAAVSTCYEAVRKIKFGGAQYRTDIAGRALKQNTAASN